MRFFDTLGEEKLAKARKWFFLGIAIIGVLLTALTMVFPFMEYVDSMYREKLLPIRALIELTSNSSGTHSAVLIGFIVCIVIAVVLSIQLIVLARSIFHFLHTEQKLEKDAKIITVLATILTGLYRVSAIIICSVIRADNGLVFLGSNAFPFVFMLVVCVLYSVATTFLHGTVEQGGEETAVMPKTEKVRRCVFLGLAFVSMILVILLLWTPFYSYLLKSALEQARLLPSEIKDILRGELRVYDDIIYTAAALFSAIMIAIAIAVVLFAKCVKKVYSNEKELAKSSKALVLFSAIVTGVYFLGSIIATLICSKMGMDVSTTFNMLPFIISLVMVATYAIMLGINYDKFLKREEAKEENPEKGEKQRKNRAVMYKARAELFVCIFIIAAFSCLALLTNIVTITFSKENSLALEPITLSGATLLRDRLTLDAGSQTVAFIILVLLILVGTFFFLSLVAFLSRSNTFYKLALAAISVCTIATFLVGAFGKYYDIVQKLNEGMLTEHLNALIGGVGNFAVVLDYEITSSSLYYSLGSLAVITYLLIRNPYTKGIMMEREFAKLMEEENPHAIKGEIALKEVPEELTQLNNGNVVSIDKTTGEQKVVFADPCSIFTELDEKIPYFEEELIQKRNEIFENPTLPKLVQFIVQYARDSRLHLSYTEEDIATFIAGLGATKLSILQGMSGTGKTSLPKIVAEALYANCDIIEVESSWRDKNELLGYYNEFSKNFTPKKFTQALYRAKLNPETLTLIVLDEMNLSRIEYYFSDFLSLMENEPDKRELRLLNIPLHRTENGEKVPYAGLNEGHTIKIPSNVWFIGTANRDESTFEISDKVYDRAHTMNFNKRATKVLYYNEPMGKRFLPVKELERLFEEANQAVKFNIDTYPVIKEVEKLLAPYNISFGNRIALQIERFVNIYSSCFVTSEEIIHSAVERILLSKVVSKLELKSVENKELLATEFERLNLRSCSEFILKLNED